LEKLYKADNQFTIDNKQLYKGNNYPLVAIGLLEKYIGCWKPDGYNKKTVK